MSKLSREAEKELLGLRDRFEPLFYIGKNGFEVIFRALTLREYKNFTLVGESFLECEINNFIVQKTVLYVTGGVDALVTTAPAGIVDEVAQKVIACSGFSEGPEYIESLLQHSREKVFSPEGQIELFICSAFQGTKPSDIQNMNFATQMKMIAMAEIMLGRPFLEEKKQRKPSDKARHLDPAAQQILSQTNADKPNIQSDNAQLNQFTYGSERLSN